MTHRLRLHDQEKCKEHQKAEWKYKFLTKEILVCVCGFEAAIERKNAF